MNLPTIIKRMVVLILLVSLTGEMPISAAAQSKVVDGPFQRYLPIIARGMGLTQLGLEGGSITAFAASPSSTSRMYAGSWGGGVFRSNDAGLSWTEANGGLGNLYIQSLAVDPKNAEVIYAGTYRFGVFKSLDGGATWAPASSGLNASAIVYDLVVDPLNPATLYAGTRNPGMTPPWGGGVYKSMDGGKNWTRQNNGLAEDWVYGLAIDPVHPTTLYAALHTQGIAKSVDGAKTWQSVNTGLDDLSGRTVVVDPINPQTVYFGTWHYGVTFKSTNGGATWQPARTGLTGTKIYKLYIDPVDPKILYAATFLKGIYRTTNAGSGWDLVGFGTEFVTAMAVDRASHSTVLAGTAGAGLFRSPDGGRNWTASQQGLRAANVLSLAVDPVDSARLYAGISSGGAARSRDGGQTWLTANTGLGDRTVAALAVSPGNSQIIYAATDQYGVLKSTDSGNTWQQANNGLAALATGFVRPLEGRLANSDFARVVLAEDALEPISETPKSLLGTVAYTVQALAVDPSTPTTVYMGTDLSGVFKSTNSGGSWNSAGLSGKPIYALAIDPTRPLYIYAATDGPSGSLWKTKDGGATWNQRSGGIQNLAVYSVLIDPANVSTMYCATSSGVYRSTDVGVNWQPAGLAGQVVSVLAFYNGKLAAGAASGLYFSENGGQTWQKSSPGSLDVISMAASSQADGLLYLGTRGQGAWMYQLIWLP
jgi:photosystem II stability/assembly factor-like uncharacterized protein